ncbi:pseudouridine synthase, partial [Alcaligenes pakistanensis]
WHDAQGQHLALYRLRPQSGRKHQLRVHLSSLGAPIINDVFYPDLLPEREADDFSQPLQLLARHIAFVDP